MSENQLINHIREHRRLTRIFNRLTNDERRQVLFIAQGEADQLEEIFEFVLEGRKRK
jgi:hypothetical protein